MAGRLSDYYSPDQYMVGQLADSINPLDPHHSELGGWLAENVAPWGERVGQSVLDWQELSLEDRLLSLKEAVPEIASQFANLAASGYIGMSELMRTGSIKDAADMVTEAQQNLPSYQATDPAARQVVEQVGMLGEPFQAAAEGGGALAMEHIGSPELATGVEVALGTMLPGKGKGGGLKGGTKKVLSSERGMIPRPTKMVDVPDIRGLDVDEAINIARYEPHLIDSPSAEGKYAGGPRDIKSKRALTNQRGLLDETIERGAEGGDWYDRYREDVTEVTGGDLRDDLWMSNLEGQFSAGVAPSSEVAFALKDTNSAIASGGLPVKAARPAQQRASTRAIETNDPSQFMLGPKTGEYARRINPAALHERTGTGVNDFRHARNLGYTQKSGEPQRAGLKPSQHAYADYETALSVDRANTGRLADRSDWTGEQVQAAPWVAQKGDDLYMRGEKAYKKRAGLLAEREGLNEPIEMIARDLAFQDANKTIGDFYDKHTAFATHEQQPFVDAGHLPGLAEASLAERTAFANDPGSGWEFAPGGRDAIYAGTRLDDTGYAVRTRPSTDMQGVYTPPGGAIEYNPGKVARPLVGFETGPGKGEKSIPAADKSILDAGERIRAFIDVQGAGAWHKPWIGGPSRKSNSVSIARDKQKSTPDEMAGLQKIADKYGFENVVDTGEGFTLTTFYPGPPEISPKTMRNITDEIDDLLGPGATVHRSSVDSGYLGYESKWTGGGATQELLKTFDEIPTGTLKAMDNNPAIPRAALMRLERDQRLSEKYGIVRDDIQNARRIIGEGVGWVGRLKKALKDGAILPLVAALVVESSLDDDDDVGSLAESG